MPCLKQDECYRHGQQGYVISLLSRFELDGLFFLGCLGVLKLLRLLYHHGFSDHQQGAGHVMGLSRLVVERLQRVLRLDREGGRLKGNFFL